jgi:hypothetical protein
MATTISAPRFGRIPVATERSGIGRSKLYELAEKHRGLFKKLDGATIVDLEFLDRIVADLPAAEIGKTAEEPAPDLTIGAPGFAFQSPSQAKGTP